jgi:uncharacterized protein YndB with AHSA1/START domain
MASLTLVKQIAAGPDIVFDALIEPEGLKTWIGPDEGPVLIAESDQESAANFAFAFRCSTAASTRRWVNISRSTVRKGSP